MIKLSKNANIVLKRFLAKNIKGKIIETPEQMFKRVAKNISSIDRKYKENSKKSEKQFFEVMSNLEFLPNIPALANAGRPLQQLAACFVLPIPDDLPGIFQAVKDMALIQKSGGGTGFSFSQLRQEGSIVGDTGGVASGPVSFMKVFDSATGAIKEGGIRRGANMGLLRVDHPDIEKFINSKKNGEFENFNISIAITDEFMKAVENNKTYNLIDPHTKKKVKKSARKIFNLICENAHFNGEPGIIFIDNINKKNPTPKEKIEATNPCGEVPLLPYESCVLGSINLSAITDKKGVNYNRLAELVKIGVHFLDNMVDASEFPIKEIAEKVKENRKIGLGIMGFADCLIKQGISYDSKAAEKQAENIISFIQDKTKLASEELAKKRGSFPNIKNSIYKKMRNASVTTIAPTGTIGIIADCSEGIEPLFNVIYQRFSTHGILTEFNPLFKEEARKYKLSKKELLNIAERGTVRYSKLPSEIKKIFATAHDIKPEQHVKIQSIFQKYTDNAVSKTVNLSEKASINDVKKTFLLAYKLKCKGLTIYRDKSREKQVLKSCKCAIPKL